MTPRRGPRPLTGLLRRHHTRVVALRVALAAALVVDGLVAGILLGVQLGQVRAQRGMGAREFAFVKQEFERALGGVMPPLTASAVLVLVPVLALVRPRRSRWTALVALCLVLWVAVVVVTLVVNAPVNARARTWDPQDPPADWQALRDRWHLGQAVRTVLAGTAVAVLSAVAVARPPVDRPA